MENKGDFIYEAEILGGNDQCDLSLLKSFVLSRSYFSKFNYIYMNI